MATRVEGVPEGRLCDAADGHEAVVQVLACGHMLCVVDLGELSELGDCIVCHPDDDVGLDDDEHDAGRIEEDDEAEDD